MPLSEPYSAWFDALRTALADTSGPFAEAADAVVQRVQYWLEDAAIDELQPSPRLVEALLRDGKPQCLLSWPGHGSQRVGGGNSHDIQMEFNVRYACGSPKYDAPEDALKATGAAGYYGALIVQHFIEDKVLQLDVTGFNVPAQLLSCSQIPLDSDRGVLAYVTRWRVTKLKTYSD